MNEMFKLTGTVKDLETICYLKIRQILRKTANGRKNGLCSGVGVNGQLKCQNIGTDEMFLSYGENTCLILKYQYRLCGTITK